MKQVVITDNAIKDIEKAKKWYDKQQLNLGIKFSEHIFKYITDITVNPLGYPNKYKYTRELVIKRFPYIIIYSMEEDFIFILRVFPGKTNPKKKYKIA